MIYAILIVGFIITWILILDNRDVGCQHNFSYAHLEKEKEFDELA